MPILLIGLALFPAAAPAEERTPVLPYSLGKLRPDCRNAELQHAKAKQPARARMLGQEPTASQYLAVLRLEDGCDKPVKIRERVGAVPALSAGPGRTAQMSSTSRP